MHFIAAILKKNVGSYLSALLINRVSIFLRMLFRYLDDTALLLFCSSRTTVESAVGAR